MRPKRYDRVLVPTGAYRAKAEYEWGTVERIAVGATPYPVKVVFPDGLRGQFRFDEVVDVRSAELTREMVPSDYTDEQFEAWKRKVQEDG